MYYKYFRYIIGCIGREAGSLIDVGSGNAPYLEWFDWIPERISVDIRHPYSSKNVLGVEGDIRKLDFSEIFDLCTCMQVLEHIDDPEPFASRLLELGKLLLISVPYKWPEGKTPGHVNDPVDGSVLKKWFHRTPNYQIVVREPFLNERARLFAIYDAGDPKRKFGSAIRRSIEI